MPGSAAGNDDLVPNSPSIAADTSAGEAAAGPQHVGEAGPGEMGYGEIEAMDSGGGHGAVDGVSSGVEVGTPEDVQMGPDGEGDEVGQPVGVRIAGNGGKGEPGESGGVEEVGRDKGGVLREDAEEVVGPAEPPRGEQGRRRGEDRSPGAGGGAEPRVVGDGEGGEDGGGDVVGEAWDQHADRRQVQVINLHGTETKGEGERGRSERGRRRRGGASSSAFSSSLLPSRRRSKSIEISLSLQGTEVKEDRLGRLELGRSRRRRRRRRGDSFSALSAAMGTTTTAIEIS